MSLQVWLPLDGNLENKGLSDVTVTNNGAVVNTSGKIGSCYSFDGSDDITTSSIDTSSWTNFSICCWAKADSSISDGTWHRICGVDDHKFFQLDMSSTDIPRFFVSSAGSTSGFGASGTTSIVDGLWHHICGTANDTEIALYIDGSLIKTTARTAIYYPDSAVARVGSVNNGSKFVGQINDVRIYDHCLSQKEVKELSKGLIGHWPLNDMVGGENLQPGSHDFTKWVISANAVKHDGYVTLNGTTANWNASVHSAKMEASLLDGTTTYTWSFEYRCNDSWSMLGVIGGSSLTTSQSGNTRTKYSNWQSLTTVVSSEGIWKRFVFTSRTIAVSQLTSGSGDVNSWFLQLYNRTDDVSVDIRNFKLEKGSIATPWTPNPVDTEYSAMGLDEGVVYDCSGYGRNGSVSANPPTVDVDTPRYSVCNKFNGSNNFIMLGRDAMVKDEITVNAWAYMSDWSTYNSRIISCTEGGGWNFEPASGKINFGIGTGTSSNTYKSAASATTILTTLSSGWHMFTGTYDGLASKVYVDAVLQGTNNAYTTKTPIFYNASNGIFIGAEAGGNQTTPAGNYFNGKLSDVRIYATALSADDIKELYETAASVDDHGNFWGYELSET